jgi:hypothetical protein
MITTKMPIYCNPSTSDVAAAIAVRHGPWLAAVSLGRDLRRRSAGESRCDGGERQCIGIPDEEIWMSGEHSIRQ